MDMEEITQQAVSKAGGAAALARKLVSKKHPKGISRQAVSGWEIVPVCHVLKVEEVTGYSRYKLRPDVYGKPPRNSQ